MGLDMLIPFGILLVLVVFLIYTRSKFEKDIVQLYENKFEEWKKNDTSKVRDEVVHKELVGLVFKEGYKVKIELLNENARNSLEKGKFEITNK